MEDNTRMEVGNLGELFKNVLRISNETSKEDFLTSLRTLAERIDVEELFNTTYIPDAEQTDNSPVNHPMSNPHYLGPVALGSQHYSEAFGSAYDEYHVAPIIVNDIGDDYQLNANYAAELTEKRKNRGIYNEDGTLKVEAVEKGSTVSAPAYNRSLPAAKTTIEDAIASYIATYVETHGGSPEEYVKEVERIRDEKYKAFYEKMCGGDARRAEIEGRDYASRD
jgi:hypothetical protein